MTARAVTSRDFNQDTGRAKRAARDGPVYITDRGRPSHVLLTFEAYNELATHSIAMADLLSATPGIGDVQFEPSRSRDLPEPMSFD
jgi:prevent-host-death family protein